MSQSPVDPGPAIGLNLARDDRNPNQRFAHVDAASRVLAGGGIFVAPLTNFLFNTRRRQHANADQSDGAS
jgi:hypothetical protein